MRRFVFRIIFSTIAFIIGLLGFAHYQNNEKVEEGDMSGPAIVCAEEFLLDDARVVSLSFMDISLDAYQEKYSDTQLKNQKVYQYYVCFEQDTEKKGLSAQQSIIQYATQQDIANLPNEYYVILTLHLFESEEAAREWYLEDIWWHGVWEKKKELTAGSDVSWHDIEVSIETEEELYKYLVLADAKRWNCDEITLFYSTVNLIKGNRIMELTSNTDLFNNEPPEITINAISRILDYDFSEEIASLNHNEHEGEKQ